MKRIKTFSIEEVEAIVKEAVINSCCVSLEKANGGSVNIEGYDVYKRSMRYKTFIEKGYK